MTKLLITGWEHGVATPVESGGGIATSVTGTTISVQNTIKNTGNYAVRFDTTTTNAFLGYTTASPTIVTGRIYFRVATAPSANTVFVRAITTAGADLGIKYDVADNKMYARVIGVQDGNAYDTAISADTWYRLDFRFDVSANPNKIDFQINGNVVTQSTYAQAATSISSITVGNTDAVTMNVYFDDLVLTDASGDYPIGPGGTELLVPSADGTHVPGTNVMEDQAGNDINGTSVTAYDKLNSVPPSSTTYIRQAQTNTSDYVEVLFGNITASHSAIIGAQAFLAYTSATTSSNTAVCVISKDDFSTSTTVWGGAGTSLADYSDGSTSLPWYKRAIINNVTDDTTVDALEARLGYSGDANPDPYWIDLLIEVGYTIASGTEYPQTVSGGITPSGAIFKDGRKVLTGGSTPSGALNKLSSKFYEGSIIPSGSVLKETQKLLSGAITSITGAVTTAIIFGKTLVGEIIPSGDILKQAQKFLSGNNTPVGTLSNQGQKNLSGSITPDGTISKLTNKFFTGAITSIAGALQAAKVALISLGGALTPSGDLSKQGQKILLGDLITSGVLTKITEKFLSGILTTIVGTLDRAKQAVKSLEGTLTLSGTSEKQTNKPLSGAINSIVGTLQGTKQAVKALEGTLASSGTLLKQTYKSFIGDITPSGSIIKDILKALLGALSSAGDLVADFIPGGGNLFFQSISGELAPVGTLLKSTAKNFVGSLTSDGSLLKSVSKFFTGTLTPSGNIFKLTNKIFTGDIALAGTLASIKTFLKMLDGTLTSVGTLVKETGKQLSGNIVPTGIVNKLVSIFLSGIIIPIGIVNKLMQRILSGALSLSGTLTSLVGDFDVIISKVYLEGEYALKAALVGLLSGTTRISGIKKAITSLLGTLEDD